jgi:hypothetical protein
MKDKIISILKQFEQKDYKLGGTSIAPERYSGIADKIIKEIIEPEILAKEHFRSQRDKGIVESNNKVFEFGLKKHYKKGDVVVWRGKNPCVGIIKSQNIDDINCFNICKSHNSLHYSNLRLAHTKEILMLEKKKMMLL